MSITWDEQGREGEWKTEAPGRAGARRTMLAQVAALAILAVIGGAGGAGIAAWALHDGAAAPQAVTEEAATEEAVIRKAAREEAAPEATASMPAAETVAPRQAETQQAETPRQPQPEPSIREAAPSLAQPDAPAADPSGLRQFASFVPGGETAFVADAAPEPLDAGIAPDAAPLAEAAMSAAIEAGGIDVAETASILSPGEPVAVADTPEQAARLEALMADEAAGSGGEGGSDATVSPAGKPLAPAWAAEYVNLRAAPDNDAAVLAIVPANADLLAEVDCVHWCAVVHDGTPGYIYRTFIRR